MWNLILSDAHGRELRRLPFGAGLLLIGRGKDSGLVLDSKAASRRHAQLEAAAGVVMLADLGSANGTLHNGKRLERPARLEVGDEVVIAEFRLRLEREHTPRTEVVEPAPAPAPAPVLAPAAAEPQIRIPATAPVASVEATERAPGDSWSAGQLLDEQLRSIRSFREANHEEGDGKLSTFEQGWDKVVGAMRELQQQLRGNPRVLLFEISRNQREITVKVADASARRGHAYMILSPEHPEGKFRDRTTVWLREFGEADANYDDPHEAMRYFVQRIAAKIA